MQMPTGKGTFSKILSALVGKPVFRLVSQLVKVGGAGKVDHGWGATHEHDVVSRRWEEVILDNVGRNEAHAVLPG